MKDKKVKKNLCKIFSRRNSRGSENAKRKAKEARRN